MEAGKEGEPDRSLVRTTGSGEKEGLTSFPLPSLVWAAPGVDFSLALPIAKAKDIYPIYRNAWQQDDKVGSLSPGLSLVAKDFWKGLCPQVGWSMPHPFLPHHPYPAQ